MTYSLVCGAAFVGSATFAENLSLYSFDENGAVLGMSNLTSGDENVAIGDEALKANTSGSNNTAVGQNSLYSNTSGSRNVAVGREALNNNITGTQNTAVAATH